MIALHWLSLLLYAIVEAAIVAGVIYYFLWPKGK